MRDAILRSCTQGALKRPGWVVGVGILLAIISATYAYFFLRMNANTDDLISADRPYMKNYRAFLDEFGDLESIFAVVAAPQGREEEARAAVEDLADRINSHSELPRAHYRIERTEKLRLATWNMSEDELAGFRDGAKTIGLIRAGIGATELTERSLAQAKEIKRSVLPKTQRELGASLVLSAQILTAVIEQGRADQELADLLDIEPDYLVSETGRLYFIELLPAKDYGTLAVIEEPLKLIRKELDAVREVHPDLLMGLTGKPVLQADEMATTDRDMTRSSIIAIILVALIFMLMMGGVRRPALAVLTLVMGIAWTFGLATLVVGQLNLLSIVFTLILVGIGIDFGIHVIARYQEELLTHRPEEALTRALLHSGRGNLSGALTSSAAFFMAMLTDFQGLKELGFIAGTGIVFCLLAMMTVLPALLVLTDFQRKAATKPQETVSRDYQNLILRNPLRWLALLTVLSLCLLPFCTRPGFSGNVLELQATGLESVEWEHRVLDDSAAASWFGAARADSLEEVATFRRRAAREITVGQVVSVLDFLPAPTEERRAALAELSRSAAIPEIAFQTAKPLQAETVKDLAIAIRSLATLAEGRAADDEVAELNGLALDLARVAKTLAGEAAKADALRARIAEKLGELRAAFNSMITGADMTIADLMPDALRHRLVADSGRFLVSIHPRENVWDLENMAQFVAALERIDPEVTGVPITHYRSILDMRDGFGSAALYALLAVCLIVLLDFRSPFYAFMAVTPLLVGAIWLLLAMGIADLSFNLANFFSVPILIGLGVDNGIHLVHRFREGGSARLAFSATHRGIILTSATSFIGFGCLAFATHKGLQSLGLVMAMGCLSCLAASLMVLPSLLALILRFKRS